MATAAQNSHPILMSSPMVRAILDGRKTQTRRVMSCQPKAEWTEIGVSFQYGRTTATYRAFPDGGSARWAICDCPYGQPGDCLWVRETHLLRHAGKDVLYRADFPAIEAAGLGGMYGGWRPSIHMFRWASRITLEITAVRVERVQDISEADATAEGMDEIELPGIRYADNNPSHPVPANTEATNLDRFCWLWDSINGKRPGCAWADNPWIFAITFKRITP